MVDVDETYREPLLGEAFYHEKALTVTRVWHGIFTQTNGCVSHNQPVAEYLPLSIFITAEYSGQIST